MTHLKVGLCSILFFVISGNVANAGNKDNDRMVSNLTKEFQTAFSMTPESSDSNTSTDRSLTGSWKCDLYSAIPRSTKDKAHFRCITFKPTDENEESWQDTKAEDDSGYYKIYVTTVGKIRRDEKREEIEGLLHGYYFGSGKVTANFQFLETDLIVEIRDHEFISGRDQSTANPKYSVNAFMKCTPTAKAQSCCNIF